VLGRRSARADRCARASCYGRSLGLSHAEAGAVDLAGRPSIRAALAAGTGAVRTRDDQERQVIASYATVPDTTWILVEEEGWAALVAPATRLGLLALALLALGVALPVGIVTVGLRRITQPVAALTDAARRIAQGEFGRVVEIPTEDELHELATAFNRMSTELADLYDKLERKVADRTRQLATLNAIASVASRSQEVAEVLQGALDRTLEGIDTCAGLAFACRRHPPELTLTGYRGVSPELVAAAGRCTTRSDPCPTCDPSVARYRPSVWGNWEPFWRARDGSTRSSCP